MTVKSKRTLEKKTTPAEILTGAVIKLEPPTVHHKFLALNKIEATRCLQRQLKFIHSDLEKFIISASVPGVTYEFFCSPGAMWWANGLDRTEWLSESFLLFTDEEEIKQLLTKRSPPKNTDKINIYLLKLKDGDVCLELLSTLLRSEK